jgi:formylglycine-generating enzyme required for sulfatase activity
MFDMLGNAWEWCHDASVPYPAVPDDREQAVRAEEPRVLRGGGFFSAAAELRAAHRFQFHPNVSVSQAGFRVARTLR